MCFPLLKIYRQLLVFIGSQCPSRGDAGTQAVSVGVCGVSPPSCVPSWATALMCTEGRAERECVKEDTENVLSARPGKARHSSCHIGQLVVPGHL